MSVAGTAGSVVGWYPTEAHGRPRKDRRDGPRWSADATPNLSEPRGAFHAAVPPTHLPHTEPYER